MRDGRFILFQDAAGFWCAAPPGFRDLMQDPTGWGRSPRDAVERLLARHDYQERANVAGWNPVVEDFTLVPDPIGWDGAICGAPARPPYTRVRLHIIQDSEVR
jgi:hypothetical protein